LAEGNELLGQGLTKNKAEDRSIYRISVDVGFQEGRIGVWKGRVASAVLSIVILSILLLSYLPIGNTINRIVGIGFACFFFLLWLAIRKSLLLGGEVKVLIAWVFFSQIPSLFALNPWAAIENTTTMFQLVAMLVMTTNIVYWVGSERSFAWTFCVAVVLSYFFSLTPLSGFDIGGRQVGEVAGRTVGTLRNANTFGIVAVEAQLLLIYLGLTSIGRRERLLASAVFLVLSIAVLKSGSRTATLGLLVLSAGFAWVGQAANIVRRPGRFILFAILIFLMAIAGYTIIRRDEGVLARYTAASRIAVSGDLREEGGAYSIRGRLALAKMALNLMIEQPFGVGLANFKSYSAKYSHSNYLEVAVGSGLVGLFLYYLIYAMFFWRSRALVKACQNGPERLGARVLIFFPIIMMAMDITNVSYYSKDLWLSFGILLASQKLILERVLSVTNRHS
jgi:O-antigen ligase